MVMVNRYKWVWHGKSDTGHFVWETEDGKLVSGNPPNESLIASAIEKTEATYYATVVSEFVKACKEKNLNVTLLSVEVKAQIVWGTRKTSCYYVKRGEARRCSYDQPFYMDVVGEVLFESEQPLHQAQSPIVISTSLLWVIGKVIALIIVAVGVAWGIYEFLKNLSLHQESSEITIEEYDEEGHLIKKTTEKITKTEASWQAVVLVVAIVIVAFAFLVGFGVLLGKKKKR
jgi:hypothetical protein